MARAVPGTGALLVLLLLAAGCAPPAEAPDAGSGLDRARALREAGDLEGAAFTLRGAIAAHPEEPSLHLEMARVDLASGRSDLALVSLQKARSAGADAAAAAALEAAALYAAGDRQALEALAATGAAQAPDTGFVVRYYRARLLVEDPHALPEEVFAAFFALERRRGELGEAARAGLEAQGVLAALAALTARHPAAAAARAHVACTGTEAPVRRWQPLEVAPGRRVLRVGPGQALTTVAAAAAAARDGDVVEIEAGDYSGDVAVWPQHGLLVRGVGGRPHVSADGRRVRDRDVWLFTGDDIVVENVEISGARSPKYRNGAAIRHVGRNLTLRHVYLHHNENGLLTGGRHPDEANLIEYSEFAFNGDGEGYAHNIYIGPSAQLTVRYSYSHDSHVGHLLKSRAARTVIEYSRLTDEAGDSSYVVDVPWGGEVTLLGNVLGQGAATVNKHAVSYGAEGERYAVNRLDVINNTVYNRAPKGVFVKLAQDVPTRLINNLVAGVPVALVSTVHLHAVERAANFTGVDHGLEAPREYRFAPTFDSPAIDRGEAVSPSPAREYVHPLGWRPRAPVARPDIGAYEACRGVLATPLSGAAAR